MAIARPYTLKSREKTMKKILITGLLGLFVMAAVSADTVVCYFSCTGNSRALAEKAAKVLNADLFEIVPQEPYTDADINWHDSNSRSSKEFNDSKNRPAIRTLKQIRGDNEIIDVSMYDTVVLAFPIWWNTAPKIMWSFVEQNDLSGKTVVPNFPPPPVKSN